MMKLPYNLTTIHYIFLIILPNYKLKYKNIQIIVLVIIIRMFYIELLASILYKFKFNFSNILEKFQYREVVAIVKIIDEHVVQIFLIMF